MSTCLRCGGTGYDGNHEPCTECDAYDKLFRIKIPNIPAQYAMSRYSSAALPLQYSDFAKQLESILEDIELRKDLRNYLICSPYRTGKSVWSYDLLSRLAMRGTQILPIQDVSEIRRILYSYKEDDVELMSDIAYVPVLICRLPPMMPSGTIEMMQTILYKRISNNGQTIFLYSDTYSSLTQGSDRKEVLSQIVGDGYMGSVKVITYRRSSDV